MNDKDDHAARRRLLRFTAAFLITISMVLAIVHYRRLNRSAELLSIVRNAGGRACAADGYSQTAELDGAMRRDYVSDFASPRKIEYLFIPSQGSALVSDAVNMFPQLQVLSLAGCEIEASLFFDAKFHEMLVSFEAFNCRVVHSAAATSEPACDNSRLRKLIFSSCECIDDSLIQSFSHSDDLEVLDLSNSEISGESVSVLQRFRRLRELSIAGCSLSDADVLQMLQAMPQLETLYLKDTPTSAVLFHTLSKTNVRLIQLSRAQSKAFANDPASLCGDFPRTVWCEDDHRIDWEKIVSKCPSLTIQRYKTLAE